jgi:CRP-like cAMP-binding protein
MTTGFFRHEKDLLSFSAGQVIFSEGDPGDVMYGVAAGEVDILVQGNLVETASPGTIFGEMALVDDSPRSATAVAKSDCSLATIDERRFLYMVENTPFFALQVMRRMASRLRRLDEMAFGE